MTSRTTHVFNFEVEIQNVRSNLDRVNQLFDQTSQRLNSLGGQNVGVDLAAQFDKPRQAIVGFQSRIEQLQKDLLDLQKLRLNLERVVESGRPAAAPLGQEARLIGRRAGFIGVEDASTALGSLDALREEKVRETEAAVRSLNGALAELEAGVRDFGEAATLFLELRPVLESLADQLEKLGRFPEASKLRDDIAQLTQQFQAADGQAEKFERRLALLASARQKLVQLRDTGVSVPLTSEELGELGRQRQVSRVNAAKAVREIEQQIATTQQGADNARLSAQDAVIAKARKYLGLIDKADADSARILRRVATSPLAEERPLSPTESDIAALQRTRFVQETGREPVSQRLARHFEENGTPIERALFSIFDGAGRRFITAFQYAFSGTAIYLAQRFAREFIQQAIEVERAFADIGTALELDLADEGISRGTGAFARSLEEVRQDVLQLADEFNILPSEANQAAFVMISRFNDVSLALQATRAQLLATKVSTIDQAEVLRALTAVAEGFANSTVTSTENLSATERLFRRQTIAAANYGKVLDVATFIQQRFGVTLEDTIEGAARANEVFIQLGFTIEETSAIVALVSQQIGTTGVVAAEQLGRAFSNLTAPDVRDELLDLAAVTDGFDLSIRDFETGARAWERITSQLERLRGSDTGNQLQETIIQIVGKRRETAALAAALATSEIARATAAGAEGAAGAAEARFEILEKTLSETVASISGQFQELAQNLAELGLLAPIKVFLGAVNGALNVVNELLKSLRDLLGLFDDIQIGGFGFGELLINVASLALALKGVGALLVGFAGFSKQIIDLKGGAGLGAKAAGLLGRVVSPNTDRATGRFIQSLNVAGESIKEQGGIFKALGNRANALSVSFVANNAALIANTKSIIANTIARFRESFPRLAGLLTRFGGALRTAFAVLGRFAGPIGYATFGLGLLAFEAFQAARAFSEFRERQEESVRIARKEATAQGGTDADVDLAGARASIGELDRELETIENGFFKQAKNSALGAAAGFIAIFSEQFREEFEPERWLAGFGQIFAGLTFTGDPVKDITGGFRTLRGQVPSSEEFYERLYGAALQENIDAQQRVLSERIRGLNQATPEGRERYQALLARFGSVQRQLLVADSDERRQELLRLLVGIEEDLAEYVEGIPGSISGVLRQIDIINRDQQAGVISTETAAAQLREKIALLRALADDAEAGGERQEAKQAREDARQAELDLYQLEIQAFDDELSVAERIEDSEKRLTGTIRILEDKIRYLQDQGLTNNQAFVDALLDLAEARESLVEALAESRLEEAADRFSFNQALDKSPEDALESMEKYAAELRAMYPAMAAAFLITGDEGPWRSFLETLQNINRQIERARVDLAARVAEARIRLGGRVRDPLADISATIEGIRIRLQSATGVEAAELQVQLNDAIASQVEALAERAAEWTRASAGVNNAIRSSQAELVIVREQLRITAALFGEKSAEYARLSLQEQQIEFELRNYALELADIRRRLASDVTSSFEQAQLDLVSVLQQLQAPEMGELEKARLELERNNAEARAEREFFNDALFQLEFAFETGSLGEQGYLASLRRLLSQVDTTTQQGKEIFLQIQGLIDGMTDDISDLAFNIPGAIRLPTLFEVRRALTADQLGVNYLDNRQQDIQLFVSNEVDLQAVLNALDSAFGSNINIESSRYATGGAGITLGGF